MHKTTSRRMCINHNKQDKQDTRRRALCSAMYIVFSSSTKLPLHVCIELYTVDIIIVDQTEANAGVIS
jgi:hypothetical protein